MHYLKIILLSPELKSHPLLGTTLLLFYHASIQASLTTRESPLFPILGNPQFPPGFRSSEFKTLRHSSCNQASKFQVAAK